MPLKIINAEDKLVRMRLRKKFAYRRGSETCCECVQKGRAASFMPAQGQADASALSMPQNVRPPNGVSPNMVQGIMAGGHNAVFRSKKA